MSAKSAQDVSKTSKNDLSMTTVIKKEITEILKNDETAVRVQSISFSLGHHADNLDYFSSQKTSLEPSSSLSEKNPQNIEEIMKEYIRTPNDTNDPSFTNLTLPYRVICGQRYRKAGVQQRAQFIKEIKAHEQFRAKALDGVRIHRDFCNAIINKISPKELITLTRKQNEKLEALLKEQ